MSSKINISGILREHVSTLRDATTKRLSIIDILSFYALPILFAILFIYFNVNISESVSSLLVNFGAIFTALLLSVLVLVYDQSSKVRDVTETPIINLKKKLLKELFSNICYSIILSLALIIANLFHSIMLDVNSYIDIPYSLETIEILWGEHIFTPIIVFLTAHLVLTVIMIVKRMSNLLNTD